LRRGCPPGAAPLDGADIMANAAASKTDQHGNVKGTLLIARMKYLRSRGVEATERILQRMPAADQAVLRGMLLPSTWYPGDLLLRLEMTIVAILAKGDRQELFLDMGRFSAETNLGPNGVQ